MQNIGFLHPGLLMRSGVLKSYVLELSAGEGQLNREDARVPIAERHHS